MMPSVFLAGLTPGNTQVKAGDREGTAVAILLYDRWQSNPRDESAVFARRVSDERGEVEVDLGVLPVGTPLRIHIRELGFRYLGFNIKTDKYGVNYPVRLEPDPTVTEDFVLKKYPNSVRSTWNSEDEFQKALIKVIARRAKLESGE